MNFIQPEDVPQKVHKLLIDKWGIGLFKFAQVFAISPVELILRRNDYPFSAREIREIRLNLRHLQNGVLTRGRNILRITSKLMEQSVDSMTDDELIKHMRLEGFFKDYVHRHEIAARCAERMSLQGKRGSLLKRKSMIAVGWGNMISSSGCRVNWRILGDLYFWLWEKLPHSGFYKEWKPGDGIEEELRGQYNRHRWPGGAANYLGEHLKIKKAEIPEFLISFFEQQIAGGKEGYLKLRLRLNVDDYPRLFLNFIIDSFLAEAEGMTIFGRKQSFADPMFLFLFIWLQKKTCIKPFLPKSGGKGTEDALFGESEIPYADSDLDDFFNLALSIYQGHNADINSLPPLIIFPDQTYFSSSF